MRVRALVNNQVMLILIDSGISHSFCNAKFLERVNIVPTNTISVQVQVANSDKMVTSSFVFGFQWWAQGTTFEWDMRTLNLGASDAILGYD